MRRIIAYSCLLILGNSLTGCDLMNIESFNDSRTIKLSDNVHLHRTGGPDVTITDGDGFGIVYGKVKRIGRNDKASKYVLIAYEPFTNDDDSVVSGSLKLVKIDLESAEVSELDDLDGRQIQSLEDINRFFP